jgi:hypothetical protein
MDYQRRSESGKKLCIAALCLLGLHLLLLLTLFAPLSGAAVRTIRLALVLLAVAALLLLRRGLTVRREADRRLFCLAYAEHCRTGRPPKGVGYTRDGLLLYPGRRALPPSFQSARLADIAAAANVSPAQLSAELRELLDAGLLTQASLEADRLALPVPTLPEGAVRCPYCSGEVTPRGGLYICPHCRRVFR